MWSKERVSKCRELELSRTATIEKVDFLDEVSASSKNLVPSQRIVLEFERSNGKMRVRSAVGGSEVRLWPDGEAEGVDSVSEVGGVAESNRPAGNRGDPELRFERSYSSDVFRVSSFWVQSFRNLFVKKVTTYSIVKS